MSDEQTIQWPRFMMVTYSAPTSVPYGWDAELLEKGAPDGLVCEAARKLTLIEDPDAGPLVCFGTGHLADIYVCLDPRARRVVDVFAYGVGETTGPPPKIIRSAQVVNSSLDHFIASVRAVTERFPFDSEVTEKGRRGAEDADARDERLLNEWAQAVVELGETLDRIDPEAPSLGGEFWGVFLGDVSMGNYASEAWLDPPDC